MENTITLEELCDLNVEQVRAIHREDVSDDYVDDIDTILSIIEYGEKHNCIGHTYTIKLGEAYIGLVMIGEAVEWDSDPPEMRKRPFYRVMGFLVDNRYREHGIGAKALDMAITSMYSEFGERPIMVGCHKDNFRAQKFYERNGFKKNDAMDGDDYYFLRYPKTNIEK